MLDFDQELLFFPLLYLIEHLEGMNDTATWRAFQENMTGVKRFLVLEWFFTRWWLDLKRNIIVIAREEGFRTNPSVMIIY